MKDEEIAEERAIKFTEINYNEPDNYGTEKEIGYHAYYCGFLAGLKVRKDQLTKATEIIKELVWVEYADFTNGDYSNELSKVLEQAEQFLSEERK